MDHLTPTQRKTLRRLLREREEAARAEIRAKTAERADAPYAELAGGVTDEADEAAADLIVDVDNAMIGMDLAEVREITAALERMKNHRYGVCAGCEEPIDYARLHAYPVATRCTRCQSVHERTFAVGAHSTL